MNLICLLRQNCRRLGEKPIFVENDAPVSYGDFYQKVSLIATRLAEEGIQPGDNVLVLTPLSVDLYATLCGVWAVGGCVVIFDPSAGGEHIAACLAAIEVSAFVGNAQSLLLRLLHKPVRAIPRPLRMEKLAAPGDKGEISIAEVTPQAPALITFTSGSTGTPKAIVRSHGFLLEQHGAITGALPYAEDDVDLAVLSVFTLVNIMEGITTVLPRDSLRDIAKVDAGKLVRQIQRNRVTRVTASPRLLELLSVWAQRHGERLDSLRSINIGGGPVFPDILERVAKVADPDAIRVVYGSTEAEPIAELHYRDMTRRDIRRMQEGGGLLVGTPSQAVGLRIIRSASGQAIPPEQLDALTVPAGAWGEIVVSGKHVVQGYLNPAQNAISKIFADDATWHRTGDCGYLDPTGRLWLLGRVSQVITTGGAPVFPFAIESAIRARHHVTTAVMQVGDTLVLAVEKGRCEALIRREYQDRFTVVALDKIPLDRRHSSKVSYHTLEKLLRRKLGRPG